MTAPGSRWASGSSDMREPGEGDSLKMIPAWAVVLAIAIFAGSMYFFNYTPPRPAPSTPAATTTQAGQSTPAPTAPGTDSSAANQPAQAGQPAGTAPARPASSSQRRSIRPSQEAGRLIFSYTTSAALASYVLLIGYVSRDVKRRHMSAPLWMLIVLVMPGGIGAIVYFLLRQPLMMRCPHCTTELTEGVHFCPQCRFQVAPVCGQCYRGVQITDAYCPQCGHDVAEDLAPARLRVYSDT
jgi:Double zinc ribbon/Phospholipase_D-nuclease N-terminal